MSIIQIQQNIYREYLKTFYYFYCYKYLSLSTLFLYVYTLQISIPFVEKSEGKCNL